MTNAQIIFNARMELLEAGKIQSTGKVYEMETEDGERIRIEEPEELHTFAKWRELGRVVKKGEHAITAVTLWKQGKPKKNPDTGEEIPGKMYFTKAFLFTVGQTEPLESN